MSRTQELVLALSRRLALIAVIGSGLAGVTVLVSAGWQALEAIAALWTGASKPKAVVVDLILVVDQFLIATVFYVVALGLYELLVDQLLILPAWLQIRTLDDLKNKLLRLVVVVLAVDFLAYATEWSGESSILYLGGAVALVIVALTYFLKSAGPANR